MDPASAILDYKPDPHEDYYAILGCDELSTVGFLQLNIKIRLKFNFCLQISLEFLKIFVTFFRRNKSKPSIAVA